MSRRLRADANGKRAADALGCKSSVASPAVRDRFVQETRLARFLLKGDFVAPEIPSTCRHCGLPSAVEYCCHACEAAHALITECGLDQYYSLREGQAPKPEIERAQRAWIELLPPAVVRRDGSVERTLDVEGIRCAACVWLIERLFERREGAISARVNPGAGNVRLVYAPEQFDLGAYSADVTAVGYRLGPPRKDGEDRSLRDLVLRFGVSAAIAMNQMVLSLSLYLGLRDGALYVVMRWASFALGVAAFAVGATPFLRSAWGALRRRLIHLDVPIALGMLLAFVGSVASFFLQDGRASYFDTLSVFITLMLLGRLLQARVVAKNRRALLVDDGVEAMPVRRLTGDGSEVVPASRLVVGDRLVVTPGDLVPVKARVTSKGGTISLEALTGEADPHDVLCGDEVPAGAIAALPHALVVTAEEPFSSSNLRALIPVTDTSPTDVARATRFWHRYSGAYVAGVLTLATIGGLAHALFGRGPDAALEVVVALLVVTCPCALGIAAPLAYELAQANLRRRGVLVSRASLLDRAAEVDTLVFDKTGTLTLAALSLAEPSRLTRLPPDDRALLHTMAIRSRHPKSSALASALAGEALLDDAACEIREVRGEGLEARLPSGELARLGSTTFAGDGDGEVTFSRGGIVLAAFRFEERVAEGSRELVDGLVRDGYDVRILSGDHRERVARIGQLLGLPQTSLVDGQSPEQKASWIEAQRPKRAFFVGDGLNDVLAAEVAHASGAPSPSLPILPSRVDVCFDGPLLPGVASLLATARALHSAVTQTLAIALVYNLCAVSLALAGVMSPLLCAVFMPLSSVSAVLWVSVKLGTPIEATRSRAPKVEAPSNIALPPVPQTLQRNHNPHGRRNSTVLRERGAGRMQRRSFCLDHAGGRVRPRR